MARSTFSVMLTLATCILVTVPLSSQDLNGPHYNLNIIGVKQTKNSTMAGSNRHTIFVGLGGKDDKVTSTIWLQPGYDFRVCDGYALDTAYDCAGAPFRNQG